ncbi:hypothetical protein LIER_30173 [Lithospermum erythrorhizon]|uniref:Uncharacterized protein n=1 Tax=Lithospermum erythrorhizon TaxID=34254 RepID=A0AAV3RNK5_LITER
MRCWFIRLSNRTSVVAEQLHWTLNAMYYSKFAHELLDPAIILPASDPAMFSASDVESATALFACYYTNTLPHCSSRVHNRTVI